MILPQDVMCMIYVIYTMITFCNVSRLHVDEFTTGMSHMVVFIIMYDLRVNFLYAM
jgi:hypothetical protein